MFVYENNYCVKPILNIKRLLIECNFIYEKDVCLSNGLFENKFQINAINTKFFLGLGVRYAEYENSNEFSEIPQKCGTQVTTASLVGVDRTYQTP